MVTSEQVARPLVRPADRRGLRWLPLWAVLVAGLTVLGRLTATEPGAPSLVVPSAGVAVLWLLSRRVSIISLDGLALTALLLAVVLLSGLSVVVGVALLLGVVAQVALTAALLRRWCPEVWGVGRGGEAVDSSRDLLHLVGAVAAGGLAGGLVAVLGLLVEGAAPGPLDGALLVGRAVAGGVFVVPPALVVGRAWAVRRGDRADGRAADQPADQGGPWELAALVVASVALYGLAFVPDSLPLAFPLLIVTGWVALRFSTATAAVHGVLAGITVVVCTLQGSGPFAVTDDPRMGAVLAQLYVCVVIVAALTLGVGRDERRQLLREVRHAQADAQRQFSLMRTMVDTMPEGVLVLEGEDRVLLRNPGASVIGEEGSFTLHDLAGRPLPPDRMPSTRALRGEDVVERILVRMADGSTELLVEVTATPLPRDEDLPPRAVVVARDVTAEELQRRELAAFAGVVAHDLKNPLATIDGWVALLADEIEDGDPADGALVRQVVDKVQSASGRMQSLIRHLLQHATSRDAELHAVDIDMTALVQDIVAGREAGGAVRVEALPVVHGDENMLRQLFENLVGNALKYVVPGEPARVVVDGHATEDGAVLLAVTDNGVGIPDDSKDLVFQQFYRAHASAYSGTGLGLAICRRIVDRHQGAIAVRDNPAGRGTRIEVVLPGARDAVEG
ncbi:sensor histidine kinase [Nocardioides zeae]|uniref:Sensor-like histidine kinase SenX3 n=1 Tax=Nocardioides zeae TaxID=1457234 RepID=A0AAJ1TY37_9ACTN|nr:ATP-binding protein [Nocardioides zeae]MDQ1103874.1 signal transduction histidine kinase [Nocardioides zeae]